MDKDLLLLLQSVAMNELNKAKDYSLSYVIEHKNLLDPAFFQWLLPKLQDKTFSNRPQTAASSQEKRPEIPSEVQSLVILETVEEVKMKFNPRRYWVSAREKRLFNDIMRMCEQREVLSKAKLPCMNRTLLYGVPGTGKTEFGRYLAYTMERPFVYVDICDVVSPEQGGTAKNLKTIFEFIETFPCVFVLDEIDAIGANRGMINKGGSGDESTKTTLALMQRMDKLTQDVVIVATTNRIDMLDRALQRRFKIRHEVKAFGQDDKFFMVTNYLKDVKETGGLDITWNDDEIMTECNRNRTDSQSAFIDLCNLAIVRALDSDGVVRFSEEFSIQRPRL